MWNVKPGDLVVCVNDANQRSKDGIYPDRPIIEGDIYTILEVTFFGGDMGFRLEERADEFGAFHAHRFRPVSKPSIDCLRSLIIKPDLVREDA